jgi:AcrR family transcriptional regulator
MYNTKGNAAVSRKEVERETRRAFILDAARRILAKKGVEETSMDDIAGEAEYTRRTLYAYFRSRDEIHLSIFLEDMEARRALQQVAVLKAGNGLEKIRAWGETFYEYARHNPHAMRLQLYWDFRGIDESAISRDIFSRFEEINHKLAEDLRDMFRQGVADGSLRPDINVDMCISQYLYTLRAVLNRAISPSYSFARFDPDSYVLHYLDLFSRAIRRTGGKTA